MVNVFKETVELNRPDERTSYADDHEYTTSVISNVKLASPSSGWTVSTTGAIQSLTSTLYYNIGISKATPALEPLFKAGDIVFTADGSRYVVQSVTSHARKGVLHHYVVVLV